MSAVVTLRTSRARLQADVRLGVADNGSLVTVRVDLDRSKEVNDAMASLENLVLRTAAERVGQAKANVIVDAKIRERLPREVASEKERLAGVMEQKVKEAVRTAVRNEQEAIQARLRAERELEAQRQESARLAALVRNLEAKAGQ